MSIESARRPRRQQGVTLVELIMFIVIVSIALAGIVQIMRMTSANSADPLRRKQALMIAEALLEEVRQAGFTYCDPRSENADSAPDTKSCTVGENWGNEAAGDAPVRPFDNVNDYVGASNTAVAAFNDSTGKLADALGRRMNVDGYRATITITPDALGDIPAGAGADSDALRIRIVVDYDFNGNGGPVVLDGYRARYAPMQGGG
jgi:MSHA pilin protein MshD